MENIRGKRIMVGLSGGVDSAVTAALLKEAGALVTGVFIKGWYPPGMPCTWSDDRRDAMRVAAHIGIPFVTLDASTEYKQYVIDYLLDAYAKGHTPNPDIMCNREVKFGVFYRYAMEQGVDYVATGHYARVDDGVLMRGVDESKDQSYFLWAVPREILKKTLFPLGAHHKTHVRALAEKFALPVSRKKDSQGICFLGTISVEDFLKQEFGTHAGAAQDAKGNTVGTHEGALLSTLGERVALHSAAPGPWYVIAKDIEKNILTVSKTPRVSMLESHLALTQTNFFTEIPADGLTAQYRYHGPLISGSYEHNIFTAEKSLEEAVAQGQSLVLYKKDTCVGGGIIG